LHFVFPFVFACIKYADTLVTRLFYVRKGHAGTLQCSMVGAKNGFRIGAEIVL
jgi:hypothetical protein